METYENKNGKRRHQSDHNTSSALHEPGKTTAVKSEASHMPLKRTITTSPPDDHGTDAKPWKRLLLPACGTILILTFCMGSTASAQEKHERQIISFIVDPRAQDLRMYSHNESGRNFGSIKNLKLWLESRHEALLFAMNGGMYKKSIGHLLFYKNNQMHNAPLSLDKKIIDGAKSFSLYKKPDAHHVPVGLYIENTHTLSALDTETDMVVRRALRGEASPDARAAGTATTTIIIAHRITTLMAADRIVVLEEGRVADIGTHAELLSRPGLYRRVWEIQGK